MLRETLREVGLGLRITISTDMDSLINQAEELNEKIKYPLNCAIGVYEISKQSLRKQSN